MPKDLIDRRPQEDVAAVVLPVIGGVDVARSRLEESRGLAEASRLMLSALDWLGILKTREEDRGVKIDWPDPLPQDAREEIQAAEGKVRLGVQPGRVLEELGYTPRDNGAV